MSEATCGTQCKGWFDIDATSFQAGLISSRSCSLTGARRLSSTTSARFVRHSAPLSVHGRLRSTPLWFLPDHLHAIFTLPTSDKDFSGHWRRIKGHFSSAMIEAGLDLKRRPNGELALWQRRFWEHTIRDDRDFARHVDYVHFNPVKHGLAQRVCEWPFSSFHRYVRAGILPEDWAGDVRESGADYGEPVG